MEYFVSVENTPFYQWQLDLLIGSINQHKLGDNLLVALAESHSPTNPNFNFNLYRHNHVFGHENMGQVRGYEGLNQFYSLMWALQYGMLKQPFAYLEPDMVLFKPLQVPMLASGFPEVVFAPDAFFTLDYAEENIGPFWEWLDRDRAFYEEHWMVGSLMIFNDIPQAMFDRNVSLCELLAFEQLQHGRTEIWEHTDKLTWVLNFADYIGKAMLRGDYSLTMNMVNFTNAPVIHYKHGLPPLFNKSMFLYPPPRFVSFGDPFEALAPHAPNAGVHFMAQLAKMNLENRKSQEAELKIKEA